MLLRFPVLLPIWLASVATAEGNRAQQPGPLVLTNEQTEYPLGLHMELLEDPSLKLTI